MAEPSVPPKAGPFNLIQCCPVCKSDKCSVWTDPGHPCRRIMDAWAEKPTPCHGVVVVCECGHVHIEKQGGPQ